MLLHPDSLNIAHTVILCLSVILSPILALTTSDSERGYIPRKNSLTALLSDIAFPFGVHVQTTPIEATHT